MSNSSQLIASDLGEDLLVVAFRGHERLCRPYTFEVFFQVGGPDALDLDKGVGSRATLEISGDEGTPFRFHGVLSSVRQLAQTAQYAMYHATLVPMLWHLGQDQHSNAFTKITVPDLIEKVLQDSGALTSSDYELKLQGDYAEEELIVQYKESNLAFLQRWMEREGIYYYFDHSGDAEKIIITDHWSFHEKLEEKTVPYYPLDDDDFSADECFDTFATMHNALVKQVRLADYDYGNPALDVSSSGDVQSKGVGEISLYGGRFFDPGGAQRYATLRAEELKAREVVQYASGTTLHVSAGWHIELEDHPTSSLNKTYLAFEVRHFANLLGAGQSKLVRRWVKFEEDQTDTYRVEAHFIDSSVQYRPPHETPIPEIRGFENGVIDGEADSPYAQIDADGRYKVKFLFDESDLSGGKASTYVRMMQPHGGGTEGFHFPLRKGTEVIFTFLGGDPDRPVIAGVVPNATTPSPVAEGNHTKNILRTGSGSQMVIDDAAGKEYIHFQTPKLTELFLGGPTDQHDEEHSNQMMVIPPEDKAVGTTFDVVPSTYYLYTDGTASSWVEGKWVVNVGQDMIYHGDGKLLEDYAGPHFFNMRGPSEQWFQDLKEVTITGHDWTTVEDGRKVTVTKDLETTVSQNTRFKTTEETEIQGDGRIWMHGGDTIKIDAEKADIDIDGKSGVTMHSPQKITIESTGSDVDVKSAGKWSKWSLGNWFKFTASAGIGVTLAASSETKIGIFNDNLIGGKFETTVAVKGAISLAAAMEAKFGAALNICGAVELGMKTTKIQNLGTVEIKNLPFGLQQAATHLETKGLKVIV